MAEHIQKSSGTHDVADLLKMGKNLKCSSEGDEMRLLECPKCHQLFIRQLRREIRYARCLCGTRIKLKRRWYD